MFGLFSHSGGSTGTEARAWAAAGALVLDVRTPAEFGEGHIEGARNIPVHELGARIGELQRGRDVVVYCRSGGRSAAATAILRKASFRVLDLGPMHAW